MKPPQPSPRRTLTRPPWSPTVPCCRCPRSNPCVTAGSTLHFSNLPTGAAPYVQRLIAGEQEIFLLPSARGRPDQPATERIHPHGRRRHRRHRADAPRHQRRRAERTFERLEAGENGTVQVERTGRSATPQMSIADGRLTGPNPPGRSWHVSAASPRTRRMVRTGASGRWRLPMSAWCSP